jgi:hypothetical protein
MSHSYNKTTNNKKINKKPYCKVCHDAGKPESVYTSHYVKSRPNQNNGTTTITCPTLSATKCRHCYKLGHTTKFCPIIGENEKQSKNRKETESIVIKKATLVDRKVTNAFDILSNDSDNDDYPEEFPTLTAELKPVIVVITENKKWADIIKDNKPWAEYSDSDSDMEDDDREKYRFKPIQSVTFSTSRQNHQIYFDDEDW